MQRARTPLQTRTARMFCQGAQAALEALPMMAREGQTEGVPQWRLQVRSLEERALGQTALVHAGPVARGLAEWERGELSTLRGARSCLGHPPLPWSEPC
jgi:hypothetical protein